MNFFQKIEAKHGGRGIPNIMLYLCVLFTVGWVINLMIPSLYSDALCLNIPMVLKGQVWRLITWLLYPPDRSAIFGLIIIYVYWIIGKNLEMMWSSFQLTWFLLGGVILHIIGAFIVYAIGGIEAVLLWPQYVLTPANLSLSIMLAFMVSYPDASFLLFFVIPIKAKYLSVVYIILTVINFVNGTIGAKAEIIISLINFLIFFEISGKFEQIKWRIKNKRWRR